jgi:hypothetical protein
MVEELEILCNSPDCFIDGIIKIRDSIRKKRVQEVSCVYNDFKFKEYDPKENVFVVSIDKEFALEKFDEFCWGKRGPHHYSYGYTDGYELGIYVEEHVKKFPRTELISIPKLFSVPFAPELKLFNLNSETSKYHAELIYLIEESFKSGKKV